MNYGQLFTLLGQIKDFFVYGVFVLVSGSVLWFFLFVCMSLLLLRCYILHFLVFCVSLLFFALGFILSANSFCLCRLFSDLVVASPHLFSLVLRLGLARGWKVFWGMGGG